MRLKALLPALLAAAALGACGRADAPLAPEASPTGTGASFHHAAPYPNLQGPSTISSVGFYSWEATGDCTRPFSWWVDYADGSSSYFETDGLLELYVDASTPDFVITVGAECWDATGLASWHQTSRGVDNLMN